jgi:hypothetical protein
MKAKKIFKHILGLVLVFTVLISCDKDSVKPTVKSSVAANQLLTPSSASYVLTKDQASNVAEVFKWTKPNFGYPASVTYKLQADISTGDFSNAAVLVTTDTLTGSVIVKDFNDKMLSLGLAPEAAADVKLRVVSSVSEKVNPVYSNVVTISVTPYATSFPPIYAMGAGLKGWGPWPDNEVILTSSSYQIYETYVNLSNDTFRFFAQADWNPTSYNYPYFSTVDANFVNANDGDSNFKFVGTPGWYKITVNLKTKDVSLASASEPLLYMMGAAVNGWGPWPSAAVKMNFVSPGVFTGTATFSVEAFRFFAQADWSPTSYNYPYFTSVDSNFINANDGDSNLKFVGTPGTFNLKVDLNAKTVTTY